MFPGVLVIITSHHKVKEVNDAAAMIEVLMQGEANVITEFFLYFCISWSPVEK